MAHFVELDENNEVIQVVVVNNDKLLKDDVEDEATGIAFLEALMGKGRRWVQTSYNNNIRKRYAGIGMIYDEKVNMFAQKSPYTSWRLDENGEWQAPVERPKTDEPVEWNEDEQKWDVKTSETEKSD